MPNNAIRSIPDHQCPLLTTSVHDDADDEDDYDYMVFMMMMVMMMMMIMVMTAIVIVIVITIIVLFITKFLVQYPRVSGTTFFLSDFDILGW
jgi:hypothetical protein